jgi:peroxiredoxin
MTERFITSGANLSRPASAALLCAALALGTGCTKDADAPPGGVGGSPRPDGATTISQGVPDTSDDTPAATAVESDTLSSAPSNQDATPSNGGPADDSGEATPADVDSSAESPPPHGNQPAAAVIPQPPPPGQVYKPTVILSQDHANTCRVGLGDPFPRLTLPDLDGRPRESPQLYGDRMTVIVFWTAQGFYAREQFSRIMHECHDRYAALGVRVVAINVGDSPEVVQELAAKHNVTIPCLLDADGQAFGQVATGLLPRTYLLDAAGRIVWFDLEYSRSQRLELHDAVYYQLKQNGA